MNKYINGLIILISLFNDYKKKIKKNHNDNNDDNSDEEKDNININILNNSYNVIGKYSKKIFNKIYKIGKLTNCSQNSNNDDEIKEEYNNKINLNDNIKFNNTQDYLDNLNNINSE